MLLVYLKSVQKRVFIQPLSWKRAGSPVSLFVAIVVFLALVTMSAVQI